MDKYAKLFSKAALIYLALGAFLGIGISVRPEWGERIRFVHIHLNLLGFMIMMIASVAYHVLPRFNARPLPWPEGVKYHFYLQNAGLLGMVSTHFAGGLWAESSLHYLFVFFAVLAGAGIMLMVINLYGVLAPADSGDLPARITGDMKVGETLDKFPNALPAFLESGFSSLANPVARKTFAKVVTIDKACEKHGVDAKEFLQKLNAALFSSSAPPTPSARPSTETTVNEGRKIKVGEFCDADVMVGSVVKNYPDTREVFEKHYGDDCFSCPGHAIETVEQTAQMHNVDLQTLLKELNCVVESQLKNRT